MSETATGAPVETTGQAYWDDWALTELRDAVRPGRYGSLRGAYAGYAAALVRQWAEADGEWLRGMKEMQMRAVVKAETALRAEGLS